MNAQAEDVTTTTTRRGRDGKLYPAAKLSRQERGAAIRLAHALVHGQHLSIRAAQKVMAESFGMKRSTGTIRADLDGYVCSLCDDE
jgi:hypothetical protein